jgi:gluconate 2-dehydrogenase gamma chain
MQVPYSVLEPTMRATLAAVADRILPADDELPAASELGVVEYVARQAAGDWGRGARVYRRPPFFDADHSGHGWQYDLMPGDALLLGLSALDEQARRRHGSGYAGLPAARQDELLGALEAGALSPVGPMRGADVFELLLAVVLEGVFADPKYAGNRDRAAWRWIGFPGPPPSSAADPAVLP